MDWLRTDVFCFKAQMPNWVEEDHLMVMGIREDRRVYYAYGPIPDIIAARSEAYKAIKAKFNSYLDAPATEGEFTNEEYIGLLDSTLRKWNGFVLDAFPTGE